jgi:hypothetical protein
LIFLAKIVRAFSSSALLLAMAIGASMTLVSLEVRSQSQQKPPPPAVSIGRLPKPTITGILSGIERGFDTPSKAIAQTVESILSVLGVPNAYVIGNDVSGALLVGGRYGTGFLHSTVAPPDPVRWRAVSVGLGLGANYGRVVMLVYGLDKLDDLFGLYGSLEGNFHVILGANTSIITRGAVTIVVISSGLGLRLSGDASGILIDKDR